MGWAAVRRPRGILLPQGGLSSGDAPPILFLSAPKRERAAPGVREKDALAATLHVRAKLLYGGRREMVPAGLRGFAYGRGGVRYRLERGFPRRGYVLGRGARTHLPSSSFRAFRFATRYPGGRRGLCFRADVHIRPLHQFLRGTASGSEKRSRDNAITTPTTSAPSATGRQSQKLQKMIACPKASPNRRLHRYADPRQHRGANAPACAKSGLFFWTGHCPAILLAESTRAADCRPCGASGRKPPLWGRGSKKGGRPSGQPPRGLT